MQSSIYLKLLGFLIKKGKKKIAKDILDKALILVSKETRVAPVLVLLKVFSKLNTFIEIKKVNFRKRSHIVPFVIDYERRTYLITK